MPDEPLRILVADGNPFVRHALQAAIAGPFTMCYEAATAADALAMTADLPAHVVLLDAALPGVDTLELTKQLLRVSEGVKILILAVYESAELAKRFRLAGAHGYLIKADAGVAVMAAIRIVAAGGTFFQDHLRQTIVEKVDTSALETPGDSERRRLTAREREVLQLLAEGKSNKEVASALNISVNTIETHRARILSKLELHSMNELVRYAIRNRLIDP